MNEYQKLKVSSLKDAVVEQILQKIFSGELHAGDYLPSERALSQQMGISRSTVNKGILQLESMGFVKVNPRHGIQVIDYRKYQTPQSLTALMNYDSIALDDSLFDDLMNFRLLIECECAKLACVNYYDSTLEKMQERVNLMHEGPDNSAISQYEFHYYMTQASGNSVYAMIFRGFETMIQTLILEHYKIHPEDWKDAAEQHQRLLNSIRVRNSDEAVLITKEIITKGIESLKEKYNQSEKDASVL